jgi:hypothetical protein
LLIGLAAVDDGPEVRDLPIVGDLAFGSAHGVPRYGLLLRWQTWPDQRSTLYRRRQKVLHFGTLRLKDPCEISLMAP